MVKSVLSVSHQGQRDWALQRVSAIVMIIYSLGLIAYLLSHPGLSFTEWHSVFACNWIKVATILVIISLMFHAWIGIWTVFTDYVKPFAIRAILNCLVLLMLAACFIWGVLILWSV